MVASSVVYLRKEPSVNVINIQGPSNECAVTTRRARFNIAGPPISSTPSAPSKSQYNILEHLGNMPAQISILDLLRTSPVYKDILDQALIESRVPSDINATDFRNLVGHLSSSCALSFKPTDMPVVEPDHTLPLRIAIMVANFAVKRVMIDNGSALNICTLKFIKQAGYTEADFISEVITIKAYDNLERTT